MDFILRLHELKTNMLRPQYPIMHIGLLPAPTTASQQVVKPLSYYVLSCFCGGRFLLLHHNVLSHRTNGAMLQLNTCGLGPISSLI